MGAVMARYPCAFRRCFAEMGFHLLLLDKILTNRTCTTGLLSNA